MPCHEDDFLSVEWRVAGSSGRWQSVLDRIDRGDLPSDMLVIEKLEALETYEFRALLHRLSPDGRGHVFDGPSTGALMVGMLPNELVAPPKVTATGSASFHIDLPAVSPCREAREVRVWYLNEGLSPWQPLPERCLEREDHRVLVNALRCPVACRFRLVPQNIAGWDAPSAESEPIASAPLPDLVPWQRRVELKFGARFPQNSADPTDWSRHFRAGISTALKVSESTVRVVEVRAYGEYVVFDLPASDASSSVPEQEVEHDDPLQRLASLMVQPACTTNVALHQPVAHSSNCGNGTTSANDGDLHQYLPHGWQSCAEDRPWWSVQLPRTMEQPYVRVFVGGVPFHGLLNVHIGPGPGLGWDGETMCAALNVAEGSSTGAHCEGSGMWITISGPEAFSLAEVQVCEAVSVNALIRQPVLESLDTSFGMLEIDTTGIRDAQVLPSLMPYSDQGRDAEWRAVAHYADAFANGSVPLLLLASALPIALLTVGYAWFRRDGRSSFTRVSVSDDQTAMIKEDSAEDDDEEEVEEAGAEKGGLANTPPNAVAPPQAEIGGQKTFDGSIPASFERSDGTSVTLTVSFSNVNHIAQIFASAKKAAEDALHTHVEQFSLQYMTRFQPLQYEEAWYDSILDEGSDLASVATAKGWRVLILGEIASGPEGALATGQADAFATPPHAAGNDVLIDLQLEDASLSSSSECAQDIDLPVRFGGRGAGGE
jgi:hypothetical protein